MGAFFTLFSFFIFSLFWALARAVADVVAAFDAIDVIAAFGVIDVVADFDVFVIVFLIIIFFFLLFPSSSSSSVPLFFLFFLFVSFSSSCSSSSSSICIIFLIFAASFSGKRRFPKDFFKSLTLVRTDATEMRFSVRKISKLDSSLPLSLEYD